MMDTDEQYRRVLVVDDDEGARSLLGRVVELEGAEAQTAASGEEALDLLEMGHFDLLITDKNLPGINGLELARVARGIRPGMPVLLVTGYSSVDSARQAAAQGVIDYVIKPVIVEELRASLRRGFAVSRRRGLSAIPRVEIPCGAETETETDPPPPSAPRPAGSRDERTAPLRALSRTAERESCPPQRVSRPPIEALSFSVLVVDPDDSHRDALARVFAAQGHEVVAFPSADRAEGQVKHAGFDLLVAVPEVLLSRPHWLEQAGGRRPLGALAIMDGLGIDKVIEAIQLGARGLVAPPFAEDQVRRDLEIALSHMLEEAETGTG